MYKFKYHPDNVIYREGAYVSTYADFITAYPDFPIAEGQFFEFKHNGTFETITNGSHSIVEDLTEYQQLITAINNLG